MRAAARIGGLGTTIFTEMSALALQTGAINLGQGFPDTDGPSEVIEGAVGALRGGENQYAPLPGVPDLREAVLEHQRSFYPTIRLAVCSPGRSSSSSPPPASNTT